MDSVSRPIAEVSCRQRKGRWERLQLSTFTSFIPMELTSGGFRSMDNFGQPPNGGDGRTPTT